MAAPSKPTQWVYWRCPQCGTSLVGSQAQCGDKFVCAACGCKTTVGGAPAATPATPQAPPQTVAAARPTRPKTTIQPPPGADAIFAALRTAPADVVAEATLGPSGSSGKMLRDDPEAAARKAAALAQAEALRPIHAKNAGGAAVSSALAAAEAGSGMAGPARGASAGAQSATTGRAARGARTARGGGARGGGSDAAAARNFVPVILVTACVCLIAGGLITWYVLAGSKPGPTATTALSASPGSPQSQRENRSPNDGSSAHLPTAGLTELANARANPPPKIPPPATGDASTTAATLPGTPPANSSASATVAVLSPEDVYAAAEKSVVVISRFEPGHSKPTAFGSGFFLEGADVIVTNAHVVEHADLLEIKTRDGTVGRLDRYILFDRRRDIALLPIPEGMEVHKGLKLAVGLPRIGEKVFALGAPQGLDYTFTSGLVSQVRKDVPNYNTLIQTDASLSPGSSGGPLLNAHAEVIGVTTLASRAVADANNLNFAVAASEIKDCNDHRGEGRELPGRSEAKP